MANYDNGISTRQAIISAIKRLFYEKGFHETTYSDICSEAHVNRTTVYYHFRDKEAMRYEALWEYTTDAKKVAEAYCKDPAYQYILAMYILWYRAGTDPKMRRFGESYFADYPTFTGKADCSYYYYLMIEKMWNSFFDKSDIPDLALASVYGYIAGCSNVISDFHEQYAPLELFEHCIKTCLFTWGVIQDKVEVIWNTILQYISLIPLEEMEIRLS